MAEQGRTIGQEELRKLYSNADSQGIERKAITDELINRGHQLEGYSGRQRNQVMDNENKERAGVFGRATSRFGESFERRGQQVLDIEERRASGEQGLFSTVFQGIGTAVGTVGDVIANSVISVGDAAISLVDSTGKALTGYSVKSGAKQAANALAKSEIGQDGLKALANSVESYSAWKETNPEFAANLEATFDIASVIPIGKAGKVTAESLEVAAKTVSKGAGKAIASPVGQKLKTGIGTGVGSVRETTTRSIPRKVIENRLGLTPTERRAVMETGTTPANFVLSKNIGGFKPDKQIDELARIADESYNNITASLKGIPDTERVASPDAKKMLNTMSKEMKKDDILASEFPEYITKLDELMVQDKFSVGELNALRRDFDRIVGNKLFNSQGRVSKFADKAIADRRARVGNQISDIGRKFDIDVKSLNSDIRNSITIRNGLIRRSSQTMRNNAISLQDLGVGAILTAGNPLATVGVIGAKRSLESIAPRVAQGLFNLSKKTNVKATTARPGVPISTSDTSRGLSLLDSPTPTAGSIPKIGGIKETKPGKVNGSQSKTQNKSKQKIVKEIEDIQTKSRSKEVLKGDKGDAKKITEKLFHVSSSDIKKLTDDKILWTTKDKDYALKYGKSGSRILYEIEGNLRTLDTYTQEGGAMLVRINNSLPTNQKFSSIFNKDGGVTSFFIKDKEVIKQLKLLGFDAIRVSESFGDKIPSIAVIRPSKISKLFKVD